MGVLACHDVSTNISRPAKLKVGDKPKIQEGLEFTSSVGVMENKRHIQFMLGGLLTPYYAKKRKIELPFESYTSFFEHLYSDCSASTTAYISSDCVRDKKSLCDHIQYKWRALQEKTFEQNEKIRKNQESNGEFVSVLQKTENWKNQSKNWERNKK